MDITIENKHYKVCHISKYVFPVLILVNCRVLWLNILYVGTCTEVCSSYKQKRRGLTPGDVYPGSITFQHVKDLVDYMITCIHVQTHLY